MAKAAKAAKRPSPARLKVYRTPVGFHDAYVAAPSQAAALRAWGADANLFARGVAEVVTDAKLTAAPLAEPGKVIKVARGTAAEHLAALPKGEARAGAKTAAGRSDAKPKPRPSRAKLNAAESKLAALEQDQRVARRELERREVDLRRERTALEAAQAKSRATAVAACDAARSSYDAALAAWPT